MIIRAQSGNFLTGKVVEVPNITYVVCYDEEHTPLVVIEQVGRDVVQITRHGEPEFQMILARLNALQEVES